MRRHALPERSNQRQKRRHDGDEPPLQPTGSPDANQPPHEQSKIEAGRVDQQSLSYVRVPAQVHAAHPTGFEEMCEGPFQTLAAQPQEAQAAWAANALTIAIDRGARLGLLPPVPS